jgi:tRNA threonylcarbamoyladenosine biosynthesis protein TsaE
VADIALARPVDLAALCDEAGKLWRELGPGSVLWLSGELGSGKTTFAQAITAAAGAERARSPTFALVHEYRSASGPLIHVDCYRIRRPAEVRDLDLLVVARGARLTMIEWPERAGGLAPAPDRHVRLSHVPDPQLRMLEVFS